MTNAQSKLGNKVLCTCQEYLHPWTNNCVNATAGILLTSAPGSLRVYGVVYALSLLMRGRIPSKADLIKTLKGVLQSTAFLTTNSWAFIMLTCLLSKILGGFYWYTIALIPCFFASLIAIFLERPARRPLLTLYVSNVATEALWHMAESRGYVRSIPQGQTIIFGISISILLYLYRLGLHKTYCKDSLFNILRILVGKTEEGPLKVENNVDGVENESRRSLPPINFTSISSIIQIYDRLLNSLKCKHNSCQHRESCIKYTINGGLKPFVGGVALQVALKLLLNIKKIFQFRMDWRKTFLNKSTLKLGIFLGSFSFLYKSVSCSLRHIFGTDDPRFAIPAGLVASVAFTQYPDVTVALYVMWKMLQNVYNLAAKKGHVPNVPAFQYILYSFATAVLFHVAILEPKSIRPSYYKFLENLSGHRLTMFNMKPFDALVPTTSSGVREVIDRLKLNHNRSLPIFAMA